MNELERFLALWEAEAEKTASLMRACRRTTTGAVLQSVFGMGQRTLRSLTRVAVAGSFRSARQVGWLKWITKQSGR